MKIKTICEVTVLTDRTIRYYIEEQLISPAYTENYLGRKSFDFSQEDMDALKYISVLRRFDFTIQEIRQIIEDAGIHQRIGQILTVFKICLTLRNLLYHVLVAHQLGYHV